jgi:hypothetical protein
MGMCSSESAIEPPKTVLKEAQVSEQNGLTRSAVFKEDRF